MAEDNDAETRVDWLGKVIIPLVVASGGIVTFVWVNLSNMDQRYADLRGVVADVSAKQQLVLTRLDRIEVQMLDLTIKGARRDVWEKLISDMSDSVDELRKSQAEMEGKLREHERLHSLRR